MDRSAGRRIHNQILREARRLIRPGFFMLWFRRARLRSFLIVLVVVALLPPAVFATIMIAVFGGAIPVSVEAVFQQRLASVMLGGALLLLLALVLAYFVVRRIANSIAALSGAAETLARGRIPLLPVSGIVEVDKVADAFAKAAVERRRSEEARSRLAAIVESSNDAIVGRTLDGTITNWNNSAEKIFGYSAAEAIGRSITMMFPADQRHIVERNSDSIRRGRTIESYEAVRLRKDGGFIHVSVTVSPLKDESGNIIGVSSIARDVTESKRAEEQRLELLMRNETLIRASAEIIYDWSPLTDDLKWEGDFSRILGYTAAEMGADTASWTSRVHSDDVDRVLREVEECTRERRPYDLEYRFRRRDGSYAWMHDRGMPFVNSDGRLERMVGLLREITGRKRAEEELRVSRERLRSLAAYLQSVREKERGRIARELHDEIGQALTGLKLCLEASLRDQNGDIQAGLVEALAVGNELIGRVRDLSLELRPGMLDDLGLLPALRWHFDRYTAQTNIHVDFHHAGLEQRRFDREIETAAYRIVQEALTNVARHAKVGAVEVSVSTEEDSLRLRIEDHGTGFDLDSLPFSASVGLSGMRERAHILAGWLKIESVPGTGTLLLAELPLRTKGSNHRRSALDG